MTGGYGGSLLSPRAKTATLHCGHEFRVAHALGFRQSLVPLSFGVGAQRVGGETLAPAKNVVEPRLSHVGGNPDDARVTVDIGVQCPPVRSFEQAGRAAD